MMMIIPDGLAVDRLRLLGIVASHRTRDDPLHAGWEKALESALSFAKRSGRSLFFSSESPYADRLRHACDRFSVPFVELRCVDGEASEACIDRASRSAISLVCTGNPLPGRPTFPESRVEDRAIVILSQQLFAMQVRDHGRIMRLIEARLAEESMIPGSTMVHTRFSSKTKRRSGAAIRLLQKGAVLWLLPTEASAGLSTARRVAPSWGCRLRTSPSTTMPYGRASNQLLHSNDYLIHFTRSRQGAWPDQSRADLFDEAIRMDWHEAAPPLHSLHRILFKQRLVASSFLRRGGMPSVCFTAQCLAEALRRREFQPHLGRWDWEPFGIAICRRTLEQLGARPVRYLPTREIESLPAEDQAFAQPLARDYRHRDWTTEQEWRILNDLRLTLIPADRALVIVRSPRDARMVSPWSRWPIVYVHPDEV
jgi:hypothetical protein